MMTMRLYIVAAILLSALAGRFMWLERENDRLATNLKASQDAVEALEENVEGLRTQQETFGSLISEIQATQFRLQDEYNTLEGYINENSTDESRAADPRWQSFFDELRDDDSDTAERDVPG
jgi:chromosome segregation ATPase